MIKLPDFHEEQELWKKGYGLVIGVDEVGRGAFAGPVVAGAVVFFPCHPDRPTGGEGSHEILRFTQNDNIKIDDSKRLKPRERKNAAKWIKANCMAYGVGEVGVPTINKIGIGKATTMAMRKAIASIMYKVSSSKYNDKILNTKYMLHNTRTFVLVDAFHIKYLRGIGLQNQKAIIKGDQKSISIAAASIIAKVFRDSLMQKFTKQYSHYRWGANKGYGTKVHQEAIRTHGITRLHRAQFVSTFLAR